MMSDPFALFVERYQLARQTAMENNPQGGLVGFELEWNMLDPQLRPLFTVGSGPSQQSFVDYLRTEGLSAWTLPFSQLEVFNWMIEWATRPYYSPRSAVYEGRLMEAFMMNALNKVGRQFGERLYFWHGNLLFPTRVDHSSIPGSWHIAKRRYLERCVDLYGSALATAGTHTNLSLPEPLLAWDFMHLPTAERGDMHLDAYKSQFYITASRLMRAFTALFVATGASTPLQAQERGGQPGVVVTPFDSVRNLTFPNPAAIDQPNLYRSYEDYLQISYDLVRSGVRFGNNNWTPVRARSLAEPVERLILYTSEQLQDLYARDLYSVGDSHPVEEMAHQIEIQNLMARINLPMSRVEIRTDDGGQSLEVEIANVTFKHLLLLKFYADPEFGRAFRYDREDINRARRNEELAARHGLRAEIENPLTGKPVSLREFLTWTLTSIQPLAEALDLWEDLQPVVEMAGGASNASEALRLRLQQELGSSDEVPLEVLQMLAAEHEARLMRDIEVVAETASSSLGKDSAKLSKLLQRARDEVRHDPLVPVRFRPRPEAVLQVAYPDKTSEVVDLAQQLIRIPSVTACPEERLDDVHLAATFIFDYLRNLGLEVRYFNGGKYPAILAGFPGILEAPVMLSGHFDVVAPDPDNSQFESRLEGDYLWGRGAADMKTVVATNLVWLKDTLRLGKSSSVGYPPINMLLVGNEENGEGEPMGTPHVLAMLKDESGYQPSLLIAGERTGEKGSELWGEICSQNRGVMRFDVIARGQRGHSGVAGATASLADRIYQAYADLSRLLQSYLTLQSPDSWKSQLTFPFIKVGTPGIYNVTAAEAVMGIEVRPIPQDDLGALHQAVEAYCNEHALELQVSVMENGIACDPANPYLAALVQSVQQASGQAPLLGRKLPGTSARFAPGGQGVVWGQTGIGPHAANERHYIPSILPYYQALQAYAGLLEKGVTKG
jgi:acetylornithine deacetylase/succinyl-diaminopimelate desuccinylase-like protein